MELLSIDETARLLNMTRSMVYYRVKTKQLPPTIHTGKTRKAFIRSELDAVRVAMVRGATSEDIASLIDDLVAKRYQ